MKEVPTEKNPRRAPSRRWRKLRLFWRRVEWPLVWAVAAVAFVLGYVGFSEYFVTTHPGSRSRVTIFYLTIQLFTLESGGVEGQVNLYLQVARLLAPAVTIYTAAKALVSIFQGQLISLRLWPYKRHVVICGLGRKGFLLARSFRRAGHRVVVIELDPANAKIDAIREEGALVLQGDAALLLRKARAGTAKYVFLVLGDDGTNARGAGHARKLVAKRKGEALTCLVHIQDLRLRDLLDERELLRTKTDLFRLEFFNVYQLGVRALLKGHPLQAPDAGVAHILVVGLADAGQSLIVQAASEWHEKWGNSRGKLVVTAIDPQAGSKLRSLRHRHPQVNAVCDLIPLDIDIYSPEFRQADFMSSSERQSAPTAIYVCVEEDSQAIYAVLALLRHLPGRDTPVVLQTTDEIGLASALEDEAGANVWGSNVYYFDLVEQACDSSLLPGGTIESVAYAIHADYIRQQRDLGKSPATNPSMAPWDELPEALRESNRRQAESIGERLRAVGYEIEPLSGRRRGVESFTDAEIAVMGKMEHERWMTEHLETGWTYAPGSKDLERKTHPLLLPWEELPEEAKEYNLQAVRTVPLLLAQVGLQTFKVA